MSTPPPIILAAHGSRETPALETFRRFDAAVHQAFPHHSVIWTFAGYIQRKIQAQYSDCWCARIHTADQLAALTIQSAIVQPLFITPVPLAPAFDSLGFPTGDALLGRPEQIDEIARIIEPQINDDETAFVLCGHGSKKHPEHNQPLIELHARLHALHSNIFLATLDGPPGNRDPLNQVISSGLKRVRFIPLLFASGMHIQTDIMGDGPASWKSRLGLPCTVAAPLGDQPEVVELFLRRIRALLNSI